MLEEDQELRYAESRINNRQMDTLIGLAKGIVADGVVSQGEAEFLLSWLANNRYTDNVIIDHLRDRVGTMLSDGLLDNNEQAELFNALSDFAGDPGTMGELLRSATLPLDDPQPPVIFPGRTFLFTGTCAYGTRKQCYVFINQRGGLSAQSVNRRLDYLVIGTYVAKSWMHESYGRKIEKAMEYRERYGRPAIISEDNLSFPDVPSSPS